MWVAYTWIWKGGATLLLEMWYFKKKIHRIKINLGKWKVFVDSLRVKKNNGDSDKGQ